MDNTEEKNYYPRKAACAFFLSILTPGLGQLYNGQFLKALLFHIGIVLFVICFHVFGLNLYFRIYVLAIIIEIAWIIFIAIEAFLTARKKKKYELKGYNKWYAYLIAIVFCVLEVCTISNATRYKILKVNSDSGLPNVFVGDRVLGDFKIYNSQEPTYGDLVVFSLPNGESYVFRIIGMPNDTLSIENQLVKYKNKDFSWKPVAFSSYNKYNMNEFVGTLPNGVEYKFTTNKTVSNSENDAFKEIIVPHNSYFLLGDNRCNAADSRYIGFIKREQIKGKLVLLYFSKDFKRVNKKL